MSKRTATTWYVGAWFVWIAGVIGFAIAYRHVNTTGAFWFRDPNLVGLGTIVQVAMVVMAGCWIGALIRLAKQHDWGWFLAVLVFQLVGLGIVGMGAYRIAGPIDVDLSRPGVT